ncbi:response regulator transcription factor [Paenibacillus sonchi]|uniref:Response regulator transcription factor n=1 Tax=Paenibacillus sonchi TaxID=373687 RepID=A0A974P894_9BACL|nr:response regulator transcription factor [Paenibacillus sonchi]QQZ59120.1 response regulator transcription factor [Paenibacillus sonchi]
MNPKKILLIEDEDSIRDLLAYILRKEGYVTKEAATGTQGLEILQNFKPDMLLLDLMLPDMSGFDICKQVSLNSAIPVIMITAKSDTMDKILGMEIGADDYITKPFDSREVIARIRAIFRRIELIEGALENDTSEIIHLESEVLIHRGRREVLKRGIKVGLTNKEYDLLLFFAEHKDRVFSRFDLLDKVWGFDFAGDTRTVDIHVQRIRKKLDEEHNLSMIETVFGIGYKLVSR